MPGLKPCPPPHPPAPASGSLSFLLCEGGIHTADLGQLSRAWVREGGGTPRTLPRHPPPRWQPHSPHQSQNLPPTQGDSQGQSSAHPAVASLFHHLLGAEPSSPWKAGAGMGGGGQAESRAAASRVGATGKVWPEPRSRQLEGRSRQVGPPWAAAPAGRGPAHLAGPSQPPEPLDVLWDRGPSIVPDCKRVRLVAFTRFIVCRGAYGNWLLFPWARGVSDCGPPSATSPELSGMQTRRVRGAGGGHSSHSYNRSFSLH